MANDSDREDFVNNDEGLYDMWRKSGKGITVWVRENRALIDAYMGNVTSGRKRAHYGTYGD